MRVVVGSNTTCNALKYIWIRKMDKMMKPKELSLSRKLPQQEPHVTINTIWMINYYCVFHQKKNYYCVGYNI